jgi:hypothetical protein
MPVKKIKEMKELVEEEVIISKLELSLGREDLNAIVGKLNEVIEKVNKC